MPISGLIEELAHIRAGEGDIPVVLWDLDTASYSTLSAGNIELQEMEDGSRRISIGRNEWDDQTQPWPERRPTPLRAPP